MNSVMQQDLLRKVAAGSKKPLEASSSIPDDRFKKILKTMPVDEDQCEKDLFRMIEEEEKDEILEGVVAAAPSLNSDPEQKKEKTGAVQTPALPANAHTLFFSNSLNTPPSTSIKISLTPEVQALFEKMASTMIVMQTSGEAETTLFLDSPRFASSIFFGTQITIREFSTAPKAFNVEIVSTPSAIHAIDPCKNDLLSAFQNGHFNFSIHRFDTYIHTEERPVLHRKENSGDDHQERKGDRQ
jgi:hypothetical protein